MKTKMKNLFGEISRWFLVFPARISIIGFMLLIAAGTILLMLPVSSAGPHMGFIDALFTSTSASCVTGLAVFDTGKDFTMFGQVVILVLIQTGGLGIMTISTLFLMIAGKRPGMMGRLVIQDTFTHRGEQGPAVIIREVILFAFIIEALGAAVMFFCFIQDFNSGHALWLSVFHSVSAFCNAGFSLFSQSLIAYQEHWILNICLCALIITGGIGFLVLSELNTRFPIKRRKWSRLSLHSKLVLSTTFILLVISTLLFLFMEWNNTLAPLSVPGRFIASFFQAVSARTAGFNSLVLGNMANETLFLIIVLMFIGACPGSCGGGVKTTTVSSMILLGLSRLRGHEFLGIFNRTISESTVWKAISLVMLGIFVVIATLMMLLMSELGNISHIDSRGSFLELFFEAVSAFGTAGLSMGITGTLSDFGKLLITCVMFIGRLGPLVIGIAISRQKTVNYRYATEDIMIG